MLELEGKCQEGQEGAVIETERWLLGGIDDGRVID